MEPFYETPDKLVRTYVGDALEVLRTMADESVHCCVTSPPYFNLRDYNVAGQIGLEQSPAEFVARLVDIFREVRRVLHSGGTCWVNMGDSYAASAKDRTPEQATNNSTLSGSKQTQGGVLKQRNKISNGLKPKDLIGVPWLLAFALRDDGWYLRQEIIWAKPAPMPESVTDRCTKAHEQVFLLTKSERYFFDQEAIKEAAAYGNRGSSFTDDRDMAVRPNTGKGQRTSVVRGGFNGKTNGIKGREAFRAIVDTRNRRSVWTVGPAPYSEAHFATYPPELIRPMIRAESSEKGCCQSCLSPWSRVGGWQPSCKCEYGDPIPCTILDPFGGSGTTGMVARQEGRACVMIELNPEYAKLHRRRVEEKPAAMTYDAPLFAEA